MLRRFYEFILIYFLVADIVISGVSSKYVAELEKEVLNQFTEVKLVS